MKEKMISALGTIGGNLYNLLYAAMVIFPIWALPIRWWWKIALFVGFNLITIIPAFAGFTLLFGFAIHILEFVSLMIVMRGLQNWFAIAYYVQFAIFFILVFAPFLMSVFLSILHRAAK